MVLCLSDQHGVELGPVLQSRDSHGLFREFSEDLLHSLLDPLDVLAVDRMLTQVDDPELSHADSALLDAVVSEVVLDLPSLRIPGDEQGLLLTQQRYLRCPPRK